METWKFKTIFVTKISPSAHSNANIVETDFSKAAHQHFILFSQSTEDSFSIPLILVRLNNMLAQRIDIILEQESSQFLSQVAYMAWGFSSNIFQNRLIRIEKKKICTITANQIVYAMPFGYIASGHYNTNVFKTNWSKMALQNFIIFASWMENIFYHSADTSPPSCPLNYVLAQRMNIILQQESTQILLQAA